jgi:hypothetical protein
MFGLPSQPAFVHHRLSRRKPRSDVDEEREEADVGERGARSGRAAQVSVPWFLCSVRRARNDPQRCRVRQGLFNFSKPKRQISRSSIERRRLVMTAPKQGYDLLIVLALVGLLFGASQSVVT